MTTIKRRKFGELVVDFDRREVRKAGELLALKPKEYDLLAYLVENHGKVLSRDQMLQQVWGWDYSGGSRTVDVHIRWLREKIEADPATSGQHHHGSWDRLPVRRISAF